MSWIYSIISHYHRAIEKGEEVCLVIYEYNNLFCFPLKMSVDKKEWLEIGKTMGWKNGK